MEYSYKLDFKVRDYECDIQGVVNNGVYQNYLEHARHEFLLSAGVDFASLARSGINLVVVRAELDFRTSLSSGDVFWVGVNLVQSSRLRFDFLQDIYRSADGALVMNARITGTALNAKGRPFVSESLAAMIAQFS